MVPTLHASLVRRLLPRRPQGGHKGDFGHVLVAAGSPGMTGAAVLCALGALRAGAGLVTVAAEPGVQSVVQHLLPEAMTINRAHLKEYCRKRHINALAVGPGLGIGTPQKFLIKQLLELFLPTVLDADGLNNLSLGQFPRPAPRLIITPHEGELAHLRSVGRDAIHRRRLAYAQETAVRFGGTCVLKGHRSLVVMGGEIYQNSSGNAAMATGGMGDVLTGVISGLLAQNLAPYAAARVGVYLHGLAGDLAAVADRGLIAREVADQIPYAIARLREAS